MKRTRFDHMQCPIAQSLEQVGEWWSILIIRDAFRGLTRFDEFQHSLGLSPTILTRRLKHLVAGGIMFKQAYQTRPARYDYLLTERGKGFFPVLLTLGQWGNEALGEGRELMVPMDSQSGITQTPLLVDRATLVPLDHRRITLVPGPGARSAALAAVIQPNKESL